MVERLRMGLDEDLDPITAPYPSHISEYERGIREPPLRVLLEYARVIQVPMDVLVDRWLSIPNEGGLFLHASMLKKRKAEADLLRSEANKKEPRARKKVKPKPPTRKPK